MAAILAFALCAFGNKTILHKGWFGTQNNMLLLVAPFLQVFLTMVLVTCLAGAFVEEAPEPEDFKYIRNIQHCFYAQKHNIALSASTSIALSASYTQDEVTSLNKLHMEHVDCFPIQCNSLCHSKIYVIYIYIYIQKHHTSLDIEKLKKMVFKNHEKSSCRTIFSWTQMLKKTLAVVFF